MKTFLLFLSGMLTAAIVVAAASFFWLHQPNSLQPPVLPQPDPKDLVTITGTVTMPPDLKLYKPGTGIYRARLLYGQNLDKVVPFDYLSGETAKFPHRFNYKVLRSTIDGWLKDAQGHMVVNVVWIPGLKAFQDTLFSKYVFFEPTAEGFARIPADVFRRNSSVIELGEVKFWSAASHSRQEECRPNMNLLEGKISLPADKLKKYSGRKFALVVYPFTPQTRNMPAGAGPANFDQTVLHYQYVDFSHGPASFSVPPKPAQANLLFTTLVACEPTEDLKTCAQAAFPPIQSLHHSERAFVVLGPNHERPVCGQKGFIGSVVWP